jgi:hypothetical protein
MRVVVYEIENLRIVAVLSYLSRFPTFAFENHAMPRGNIERRRNFVMMPGRLEIQPSAFGLPRPLPPGWLQCHHARHPQSRRKLVALKRFVLAEEMKPAFRQMKGIIRLLRLRYNPVVPSLSLWRAPISKPADHKILNSIVC